MEQTKDGTIIVRYLADDDLERISGYQEIFSTNDEYYLEAGWTKEDLEGIIKAGGFSDTLLILEESEKVHPKK